ncbi:hypothetical protein N9B72_00090 [Bacteriovoracaceae bacterium]|nr:hypothetical protein [Bacteriovoracaceae bacterium]
MNAIIKNGFILLAFFFASIALVFIFNYSRYSSYSETHPKFTFKEISKKCSIDFSDKTKDITTYNKCFLEVQDNYLSDA